MSGSLPASPGAHIADDGVRFRVRSSRAERVELCLHDADGRETARIDLEPDDGGDWTAFVVGVGAGQRYGYRCHGRYAPFEGLRFNPQKLLIDPYARELAGDFSESTALYDYAPATLSSADRSAQASRTDSAGHLPFSVVAAERPPPRPGPRVPWTRTIVYETNVRGYTMRHPGLNDDERGRFRGLANGEIVDYLRALGITSVELQPVFEFVDEPFLRKKGLRNYWGYNSIAFFAPAGRYAGADARAEFVEMVNALHDAGLEVILDVVYNHTAEAGIDGPTLSFRGLDNLAYYRTAAADPGHYINDTGTGNTMNAEHPFVQELVIDSLRYWAKDMGVDGFRFDLAPVLGRRASGFDPRHPLLEAISSDEVVGTRKLIAEPWDPGPGGYQLGNHPPAWAEWNDRYRDCLRRFWRGDGGEGAEFAQRVTGSEDLFSAKLAGPAASVNFVTAHDGFTLADLVSYERRHNEPNGESNRDGHAHNFSANYGVEGDTDDDAINALRRQQRLNFLATLLLSAGTPMLLAGDEWGHSQRGNNNAYAQDNETTWMDWSEVEDNRPFTTAVRALVDLRQTTSLFRPDSFDDGRRRIRWLDGDARELGQDAQEAADVLILLLESVSEVSDGVQSAAVAFNRSAVEQRVRLPSVGRRNDWTLRFVSAAEAFRPLAGARWLLPARSIVCALLDDRRQSVRKPRSQ